MKKLYILDGNSLLNRAFYALPLLNNSNGVYSNAVFGFCNFLIKIITEDKPDALIVAFDHSRKTFRTEMYAEYKGTRKQTPFELVSQFPIVKEVLDAMGVTYIEQPGIEADDIIGTIVKHSNMQNFIITGDRDSLQLIDENTTVLLTQSGTNETKPVNLDNIKQLYGLTPSQIIDYKAIAGDKSDNIPGAPGVGDKTAMDLLDTYGDLDNIFLHIDEKSGKYMTKVKQNKDLCYLSKALATIKTDCDIAYDLDKCGYEFPFNNQVKKIFERYEFKTILRRTTLFANQMPSQPTNKDVTISSEQSLHDLLADFDEQTFVFDSKEDFSFCMQNACYKLKKCDLGLISKEEFYIIVKKSTLHILQNPKIKKIVNDLKTEMHNLQISEIPNAYDINLAEYLILGGNKPDFDNDCSKYAEIAKNQQNRLKQDDLENLYYNIELPLVNVLYQMENEGIAVDQEQLNILTKAYEKELADLESQFKSYSINPDINIKSPKQIANLLFNELQLPDKFNKKHSTNVEALAGLVDYHPVVPIILRHRKVCKLYLSYLEPYTQMLKNSQNNLIFTMFNQTQTATGRLSSSEPNLQNIPVRSEEGKGLRKLFISRYQDGHLMSFDYNQIELRLLANFSNDSKLINDYNKGADIHAITASQIFGVELSQVTDTMRRTAKAVNFGIIYGISGFGLSRNIEIPVNQAKKYIELYFEKYPGVKEYLDNMVLSAKTKGYALTLFNRRRYIPELRSNMSLQRNIGERVAMNMPLQGSASDLIKLAMINVAKKFKGNNVKSKLILQIHDELVIDTYPGEEEIIKDIVINEMQNVYKFQVPLLVSVGVGKTWYECK